MKSKQIVIAVVSIVAILGVVVFATNGTKNNETMDMTSSSQKADSGPSTSNEISIKNYMFGPEKTTVKVGTKVTWTNQDAVVHTVTADEKMDGAPDSMDIAKDGTYSFTFTKAGTYTYHCEPHPYMKATITVTE